MTEKLRNVFEDPEYYVKIFDERTKRQQKENVLIEWTDELVKNQLRGSIKVKDRALKVLGVGSGSGEVEFSNVMELQKVFPMIDVTVLEPAKDHIDEYKKLVETKSTEGLTYQWRQQTLDQYRVDGGTSNKYDVIFAVNSLYYVDGVERALQYMYDLLEDGGKFVAVVVTETTGCYQLWKKFAIYENLCFNKISSKDIIEALSNLKLPYELKRTRNDIDVTECFVDGSIEGQYMIDFLSHVIHLRESVPESVYSEFVEFLKGISGPQDGYGSKKWLESGWEAVFVQK